VIFGRDILISLYTTGIHSHRRLHTSIKNFHSVRGRDFTTIFFLAFGTTLIVSHVNVTIADHHEVMIAPVSADAVVANIDSSNELVINNQ
jgi:hypothetical protein